ncbi:MAG: DUF389 domain-containing protein [Synechococcus sp.]
MKEAPITIEEFSSIQLQSSLPTLNFYLLLSLAAAIATFGLLTNSAATIIGAMIIAPLMSPIISLAYALSVLNLRIIARATFSLFSGIALVIFISYLSASILSLSFAGPEILGRTNPNSLDLGVAVAAGLAAAFANTRKSIAMTLPGVAISVALVPPLCVLGIGLYLGDLGGQISNSAGLQTGISVGSFLLFLTNLLGIIFSSVIVFLWQGYGTVKRSLFSLSILTVSLFILFQPLDFSFDQIYTRTVATRTIFDLRQERADIFTGNTNIISVKTKFQKDGSVTIKFRIETPRDELDNVQTSTDILAEEISTRMNKAVRITADVTPILRVESQ